MQQFKTVKRIGHALIGLIFLGLPFVFFIEDKKFQLEWVLLSPYYWLFVLSFGLLFYLNYYLLIPRFYHQKKYSRYALMVASLFGFFYLLKPFLLMFRAYLLNRGMTPEPGSLLKVDIMTCALFFITVSTGLAYQVLKEARNAERKFLKAEAEKAQAELSFLKAQVNPHFLFNTLNNIYSLAIARDPDIPESIMKLSNLMRYITDEANQDQVSLTDEIASIEDYIALQHLRLCPNVTVDFSVTGNPECKQIAPLILITYIENAFKYGVSNRQPAHIAVSLHAGPDKIEFQCRNQIFATAKVLERSGKGLQNTRHRLNYLYPQKHYLNISSENGLYMVDLTLHIEPGKMPNPKTTYETEMLSYR